MCMCGCAWVCIPVEVNTSVVVSLTLSLRNEPGLSDDLECLVLKPQGSPGSPSHYQALYLVLGSEFRSSCLQRQAIVQLVLFLYVSCTPMKVDFIKNLVQFLFFENFENFIQTMDLSQSPPPLLYNRISPKSPPNS